MGSYLYERTPGRYVQGIPKRDLTPAEWKELPELKRQMALKSGAYSRITIEDESDEEKPKNGEVEDSNDEGDK